MVTNPRRCNLGPFKSSGAGAELPVSPVLSGPDQAAATPSIAISHPLAGADADDDTMRKWQLHD
jgi:hypothetical protein